jgi:spore maturation protein CgeB
MNILIYRYGSICEPDIIDAFRELGNQVNEITLEIYNKELAPLDGVTALKNELFAHSYDFVFTVNYYPFISEVCNIFQIRYISWTVDCPVLELYSDTVCNPWNRIFLFDKAQYDEIAARNPSCIFHLPLASNPSRFSAVIDRASALEHAKYSGDISFVGSLYTEKCPYDRFTHTSDYLTGYLEGIMEAQLKVYGCYFLEELLPDSIVDSFREAMPGFYIPPERSIRDDRVTMAQMYLCPKISSMERVRTMQLLGSYYPVNLYTGSDTKGLPVRNCHRVKTLTEMPLVFYNSKINLNITAKAIRTGLPLRIFDILSCGGFCLTNYQPELEEFFTPGSDLECYTSEDELLGKIEYYLAHEKDRQEIAQNGLAAVKKYHNYPERLLQMISLAFGVS